MSILGVDDEEASEGRFEEIKGHVQQDGEPDASEERGRCSDAGRYQAVTCFRPIEVPVKGFVDLRQKVACGRCIGCRRDKQQDWASRLVHESKRWVHKKFLTLTYDDSHLPGDGSLVVRDPQLWQKRLRFARKGQTLKFFTVGEYGDRFKRPHYHSIVFGLAVPDERKHSKSGDHDLCRSDEMDKIWGLGHVFVGTVTAQSCAYVAQYAVKKITGTKAGGHYEGRTPEFAVMSKRPAIGRGFYEEFKTDLFPSDYIVIAGKKRKMPAYYSDLFKKQYPEEFERIRAKRLEAAKARKGDSTPERLRVREEVAEARAKLFSGKL